MNQFDPSQGLIQPGGYSFAPPPQQTPPQQIQAAPGAMQNAGFQQQQQMLNPSVQPVPGLVKFIIEDPNGAQPLELSERNIIQTLQESGANPVGMSPDGMSITFQDQQGLYDVNTTDILKSFGHTSFTMAPQNANTDYVDPAWRMAVLKLPDDDAKKAYLESKLRKQGEEAPKVMGSGRDWYGYSNNLGQWVALTNSPDWDLSDLGEGALDVSRGLGSLVGAAAGGGAGFLGTAGAGSIPLAMAGAGLGTGAVEALQRGALATFDPEFRQATDLGAQALDIGEEALLDTVLTGGVGGAIKYAPRALAQIPGLKKFGEEGIQSGLTKAATTGPLSTALKTVAAPMEKLAGGVASTAGAVDTPIGREVFQAFTPGLSELQTAGLVSQLPKMAVESGTAGLEKAASSQFLKELLGDTAQQRLANFAGRLTEPVTNASAADIIAKGIKGAQIPRPPVAEEILQRFGQEVGFPGVGKTAGQLVGGFGKIGEAAQTLGSAGARTALGGTRALGRAAEAGAGAVRAAAEVGQKTEPYIILRKLLDEEKNRRLDDLRRKSSGSTMEEIFQKKPGKISPQLALNGV